MPLAKRQAKAGTFGNYDLTAGTIRDWAQEADELLRKLEKKKPNQNQATIQEWASETLPLRYQRGLPQSEKLERGRQAARAHLREQRTAAQGLLRLHPCTAASPAGGSPGDEARSAAQQEVGSKGEHSEQDTPFVVRALDPAKPHILGKGIFSQEVAFAGISSGV